MGDYSSTRRGFIQGGVSLLALTAIPFVSMAKPEEVRRAFGPLMGRLANRGEIVQNTVCAKTPSGGRVTTYTYDWVIDLKPTPGMKAKWRQLLFAEKVYPADAKEIKCKILGTARFELTEGVLRLTLPLKGHGNRVPDLDRLWVVEQS